MQNHGPHVPLYAGERLIGRAVEAEGGWLAVAQDGAQLGTHETLTGARAAILARLCRPLDLNEPRRGVALGVPSHV